MSTSSVKFARDVTILGITQFVSALCSFILLPIVTKALGPHDYGIWAQITVAVVLFSSVAMLGLHMSMMRYLAAEQDRRAVQEGFFSVTLVLLATGGSISFLFFVFADHIAAIVFSDPAAVGVIRVGAFLVLLAVLDNYVILYYRVFHQASKYALFVILESLGKLALIATLLSLGWGLYGAVFGLFLVQAIIVMAAFAGVLYQIGWAMPTFATLRKYLDYGVPITPNGIIRWFTDSSDRYIIGFFVGLSAVGIYSAAYQIGYLINLIVVPIQLVLLPELSRMYDTGRIEDVKNYLAFSLKYYLLLGIPAVVGLSAIAAPILDLFTTPEFGAGSRVIPLIATACLCAGVFQITTNILLILNRTRFNLFLLLAAALINIVLNLAIIPVLGFIGASISSLLSFILLMVTSRRLTARWLPFTIDYRSIGKSIVASAVMAAAILMLHPQSLVSVVVAVLLGMLIYAGCILLMNPFSAEEVLLLKNVVSSILGKSAGKKQEGT